MKGIHLPVVGLAVAAAFATGSAVAQSDSTARGRAVFDEKGCQYCHSYVSRRAAPSVRDMLRQFEGDPQAALKGIGVVAQHREALAGGKISSADQRIIAEWLGADFLPDSEGAEETPVRADAAPRTSAPVAAAPAIAPQVAPAVVARPAPAITTPAPIAGPAVNGVRLQSLSGAGGERLVVELRGGEPDSIDMRLVDNRLVMTFVGAGLASVPGHIDADPAFKVVQSVDATSAGRTVTITVVPRDIGWTYAGMQGRNRMVVDFVAQSKAVPLAKTPTAKPAVAGATVAAGAAVVAKATSGVAATAVPAGDKAARSGGEKASANKAQAKKTPASGPVGAKQAAAQKPVEPRAAEQASAEKKAAEQKAAQLKAAEQAKAQAMAQKAEQDKMREQAEATARAKAAEEAAARKREQERAAEPVKAPPAALAKVENKAEDVFSESSEGSERRKLKKKRPYKEPNLGPCPPPNPADQVIGVVDVERAKDIIERIGCPQCHAYVQKKTGPPFREVLKKYKGDPACVIHRLKTNETHKDEGVTADIRPDEFKILADYVATRMK